MRALVCKAFGSPDELVIEELADPEAGEGGLLVDVKAAGINFPDVLTIAGQYQVKTPPPFVPGSEAAGIVAEVGAGVDRFAPGDKVIFTTQGGAFAEKCAVDAARATHVPEGLDFVEAAGLTITASTSYYALKQCAALREGEVVLVLGAAGGVGITAVEIAKAMGARVIAAASTDDKLAFAKSAGADDTINYTTASLRDAVRELTDGNGVDVVYDPVGGDLAQQALKSLARNGRFLVIGFASGEIPAFPANLVLLKEANVIGVWWGPWASRNPREQYANLAAITDLIAAGRMQPRISETFALEDFCDAFRTITERRVLGKTVFRM